MCGRGNPTSVTRPAALPSPTPTLWYRGRPLRATDGPPKPTLQGGSLRFPTYTRLPPQDSPQGPPQGQLTLVFSRRKTTRGPAVFSLSGVTAHLHRPLPGSRAVSTPVTEAPGVAAHSPVGPFSVPDPRPHPFQPRCSLCPVSPWLYRGVSGLCSLWNWVFSTWVFSLKGHFRAAAGKGLQGLQSEWRGFVSYVRGPGDSAPRLPAWCPLLTQILGC